MSVGLIRCRRTTSPFASEDTSAHSVGSSRGAIADGSDGHHDDRTCHQEAGSHMRSIVPPPTVVHSHPATHASKDADTAHKARQVEHAHGRSDQV